MSDHKLEAALYTGARNYPIIPGPPAVLGPPPEVPAWADLVLAMPETTARRGGIEFPPEPVRGTVYTSRDRVNDRRAMLLTATGLMLVLVGALGYIAWSTGALP